MSFLRGLFRSHRLNFIGVFLTLHEFNVLPHHKGGFYCGDPKIAFPFEGDTISISLLLIVCTISPIVIMTTVELIQYRPEKYSMSNVRCAAGIKNAYTWFGEYLLSVVFNMFLLEVVKGIIGEPRPHFLDSCKPDKAINCTIGTYISEYTCTNTKYSKWFVSDAIKSFPSGHSAIGLYSSIFIFWYLQKRACNLRPRLLAPLFQALSLSWGLSCSFSRIMDNRHHWWDVVAGGILGLAISYHSVIVLCKNFACSNPQFVRNVGGNGDPTRQTDNHHSTGKRHINPSSIMPNEFDNGLRQIT